MFDFNISNKTIRKMLGKHGKEGFVQLIELRRADMKGSGTRDYVEVDKKYFRPTEVDILLGDYSKAKRNLGWIPKVSFNELIDIMIDEDMKLAVKEKTLLG